MFAALTVVRMREAVGREEGLLEKEAWLSEDDVDARELPLARAAESVLGSMHHVLEQTQKAMHEAKSTELAEDNVAKDSEEATKRKQSAMSKAAELRLVRNARFLLDPDITSRAQHLE